MPYIEAKEARPRVDPCLSTLLHHLLERIDATNKRTGKYFFFRLLTIFFDTLRTRIAREGEIHYVHFNNMNGAFDCAGKELWRRWRVLVPLRLRILSWETIDRGAKRYVKEADERLLVLLLSKVVDTYDPDINRWVGELNYTISEAANMLANSGKATHQELLDVLFAAANYLYAKHVGPHEDKVILKNGDTAGFTVFHEKFAPKRRGPRA